MCTAGIFFIVKLMNGSRMNEPLIIVGGGLAGSEAAWQAAERGVDICFVVGIRK